MYIVCKNANLCMIAQIKSLSNLSQTKHKDHYISIKDIFFNRTK